MCCGMETGRRMVSKKNLAGAGRNCSRGTNGGNIEGAVFKWEDKEA